MAFPDKSKRPSMPPPGGKKPDLVVAIGEGKPKDPAAPPATDEPESDTDTSQSFTCPHCGIPLCVEIDDASEEQPEAPPDGQMAPPEMPQQ